MPNRLSSAAPASPANEHLWTAAAADASCRESKTPVFVEHIAAICGVFDEHRCFAGAPYETKGRTAAARLSASADASAGVAATVSM